MDNFTEIEVQVSTTWWRSCELEQPQKGEPYLTGEIRIQLETGIYRFDWEALFAITAMRLNKDPKAVFDRFRRSDEEKKNGGWIVVFLINEVAIHVPGDWQKAVIGYRDKQNNEHSYKMHLREKMSRFIIKLASLDLANLTQFCEIHGIKVDNDATGV